MATALALLAAETPGARFRPALLVAALLGAVATGLLGPWRDPDPLPARAADLDWITTRVDQRSLLVHHGETAALLRYLESRGHRSGHVSVISGDARELRDWADRAVLDV